MRSLDKELLIVGGLGAVCFAIYLAWRRGQGVPAPAPSSVVAPIHAVAAATTKPVVAALPGQARAALRVPSDTVSYFTGKGSFASPGVRPIPLA